MKIGQHEITSGDVWEAAKIAGIIYGSYKVYGILQDFTSNPGKGGGYGTSHTTACDDVNPNNLTKPNIYFHELADGIEEGVWGAGWWPSFTEDDQAFAWALMQVNTIDDVMELICVYDVRGRGVVLDDYLSLSQTVSEYLDDDWRDIVNQDYQNKGINFQWV